MDYMTEWIPYPDIADKFKTLYVYPNLATSWLLILFTSGIPPCTETPDVVGTQFTIPAVRFPDGSYLMDSMPIAKALESAHPIPSLHLDYEELQVVIKNTGAIANSTRPNWMAKVPRDVLQPRCAEYFEKTRSGRFGMSLDQWEKKNSSDELWETVKAPAKLLGDILRKSGGPFYMGTTGKNG